MHRVITAFPRPDTAVVERLANLGRSTVTYAGPRGLGAEIALDSSIQAVRRGSTILGTAVTGEPR